MKILIVCSFTSGKISPFIEEQVNSLEKLGVKADYFFILKKGMLGYFKSYLSYFKKVGHSDYDLIHAHYGYSGFLASLQWFKPVIVTFHGSDVYIPISRIISKAAFIFSKYSIFAHKNMVQKIGAKKMFSIISCGVNTRIFYPLNKNDCRKRLNLDYDKKYILFSSNFEDKNKNYPLAKKSIELLNYPLELIELKNYNPNEVNLLMNAVDLLLVTSLHESGPLVVKEALACNCPIVSVDVGDVKLTIGDTKGCYITSFDPYDVAEKIKLAIDFSEKKIGTKGRKRIIELGLDSESIAKRIIEVYKEVLNTNK